MPGPADDAIVDQQGISVTHSVGTDSVNSLTSKAAFEVSGGSLTLLSDSALSATLVISGGTLVNGRTTSVGGPLTWTAGTLSGNGRVRADGGLAISSVSSKVLDGGTLDNAGDATWETGSISFSHGAVFNNLAGAVFVASGPRLVNTRIGASPTFNNAGLFREPDHTGTLSVDGVTFINTGRVEVENGSTLSLAAELHCNGSFAVASGGELSVGNGRHTLDTLSSVTGSGTVAFIGGDSSVTGTYNLSGNTLVSAGSVSFLVDAVTATATLSGGTLTGPGNVTVTDLLTWTGGTMSGVAAPRPAA